MTAPMPEFEPCACCGEPARKGDYSRKIVSVWLHYCDRCGPRKTK